LDDTIDNYQNDQTHGTGFKFYDATADALVGTVSWAVDVWHNDSSGFAQMRQNAMAKRYDWAVAAKEYEAVYRKIVEGRKSHQGAQG
jgi:starch synthase